MSYTIACIAVFLGAYLINIFYITVFYHRGLAHRSVTLKPWTRRWVILTGNWVTALDPKAWVCMHRMHHQLADTLLDPHSPVHSGLWKLMLVQLRSYERTLACLANGREPYIAVVRDLDFPVNWLNRKRLWFLPYVLHALIALAIAVGFDALLLAPAYWFGIMSHPIQAWMVNALGHRFGYVNFENGDNSKNNTWVALLVMGEGYQNNHHHQPQSPKFSAKWWEIDLGYLLCIVAKATRLIDIKTRARFTATQTQ
jgi:stearoyl-CoA desaturase (Delta-9 desaturase)